MSDSPNDPIPRRLPLEDDLQSSTGIDYTSLRDMLKAGKWREEARKHSLRSRIQISYKQFH